METPVTLILGLGRDVGVACARRFEESGHSVLVASPDEKSLEKARDELPDEIAYHHGNLDHQIGLRNALTAGLEAYGRRDNLVIIPPIPKPAELADINMDALDKSLTRGARSGALALHLFANAVADQPPLAGVGLERHKPMPTVTFVLSQSANQSDPGNFIEGFSQGAILALVRAGAVELAAAGIRVNAVSAIRPRVEADNADQASWLKKRTPLGRASLAEEIADAVFYLASHSAGIVTGETLTLDGGRRHLAGII